MRWLVPDFETQSACDLGSAGAYRYAVDPTTALLCCSFTFDDDQSVLWWPDQPIPQRVLTAIEKGAMFVAHNAAFERNLWTHHMVAYHGAPEIPLSQWHCSMARAQQMALPGSLDKLLNALGTPQEKDKEGRALTLSFSKPDRKTGMLPVMTPEKRARIGQYCESDTQGQTSVHRRLGWLPEHERPIWELSQIVNDRGVLLDMEFVRKAQEVVDKATGPLAARFRELTGGLNFGQIAKVRQWVEDQGVKCPDLTAETVARLLGEGLDDDDLSEDSDEAAIDGPDQDHLPFAVREALHIRQLIGSSSIKKLAAMQACVGYDGRARGLFRYHGTTPGRQTAGLFQPHNFPRGSNETIGMEVDAKVDAIMTGDPEWVKAVTGVEPVELVVGSLRHAIKAAPGRVLMSGDYTGIQLRALLAVARQYDKCEMLAQGVNAYCDMGRQIYGREIDKHIDVKEYTTSKAGVLGLGFQMGPPKFVLSAAKGGSKITLEESKLVVDVYRKEWAPCVPKLWYGLLQAATDCVWTGEEAESHEIVYRLQDKWLVAEMPNGSTLWYYDPQPVTRLMPWSTKEEPDYRKGFSYRVEKQGRLITRDAFGGQLCLGAGTQVLTPRGYLAIVDVTKDDAVWDGLEWVSHDGLIYQGLKQTISFGGIRMTEDHKVLHEEGWLPAIHGSYDQAVSLCESLGRPPFRNADSGDISRAEPQERGFVGMLMRLWKAQDSSTPRFLRRGCEARTDRRLSSAPLDPVYDLQNAGPRRRFAVRGADGRLVIVSNCENVVMKIEREIVEHAKRKLEDNGFCPIMDVHDELLSEPKTRDLEAYKQILEDVPRWVREMKVPIHVDTWMGTRYRK